MLRWNSWLCCCLLAACGGEEQARPAPPAVPAEPPLPARVSVAEVGLMTPECVVHDELADVYIVANIQGAPWAKDDDGFLSRVTPSGRVAELKWIDGAAPDVTLHAPKGLVVAGDVIHVCDIDVVRSFDRVSGRPRGEIEVPGATFLNGIAVDAQGVLWVTDTGVGENFAPTGADAVHRIDPDGSVRTVVQGTELGGPNGIVSAQGGILFVNWQRGELRRVGRDGTAPVLRQLPTAELDGLVELADGTLLTSSWGGRCVYAVPASGEPSVRVPELEQAAAIGLDRRRQRLLIPLFGANRLELVQL